MYGAGNIGRGFIGALFSQSVYSVSFIDIAKPVVNGLNEAHSYPLRLVSGDQKEDYTIKNVSAVDGMDVPAVAEAIATCDIMATAVGVRILELIVPNIVAGIRRRWEIGGPALNIIICENLNNSNRIMEGMIKSLLNPEEVARFDETVGLVEASVGRMVPIQTEEMRDGDPLRVCTEHYAFLPVDKAAFKGEIPEIKGMVPFEPFDFFCETKTVYPQHGACHNCLPWQDPWRGLHFTVNRQSLCADYCPECDVRKRPHSIETLWG